MARPMTKRQLQAELTKLKIFNTAVGLLSEKRFDDITIRDIVAKAGVSIGTFYNYYATKNDVFYQAYTVADRYFGETVAPRLTQESARERVLLFFDFYAHYSGEISGLRLTQLLYGPDNSCFERSAQGGILDTLTAALQYGIDRGELDPGEDTPEEMAKFFMVSIRGLVYNWCTLNGSFDLRARTRSYTEKYLKAYIK